METFFATLIGHTLMFIGIFGFTALGLHYRNRKAFLCICLITTGLMTMGLVQLSIDASLKFPRGNPEAFLGRWLALPIGLAVVATAYWLFKRKQPKS